MQGNCSASAGMDAQLRRLQAALTSDPVPLKPFQCLLVTNANTLFLNDGNAFWVDNLYVGVTRPRSQQGSLSVSILSVGPRIDAPLNWQMFSKPMNIFLTGITIHGHGQEVFTTRVISLTPGSSKVSLLFQGTHTANATRAP